MALQINIGTYSQSNLYFNNKLNYVGMSKENKFRFNHSYKLKKKDHFVFENVAVKNADLKKKMDSGTCTCSMQLCHYTEKWTSLYFRLPFPIQTKRYTPKWICTHLTD